MTPGDSVFGTSFWTVFVPVLAGLGCLGCAILAVYFILFRESRVVRRANLAYLLLFLLGIFCLLLSLIIWSLTQTTFTCVFKSFLGMLGLGLIVGCVLAKTQRIFRVYLNYGAISPTMGNGELAIFAGSVFLIALIFALVYTLASGEPPTGTVTQSQSDNTYIYIACTASSTSFGNWVVGFYMGVMASITLGCAFMLFLANDMETPFKEADFLFLAVVDFLVLCVVLIPNYYTVGDRLGSVLQTYLLRSLGVVFAMYLTLGIVFIPKAVYIWRQVKAERKERSGSAATVGFQSSATASASAATTHLTEFSSDEAGSSESEGDVTPRGAGGNRPQFISENISRRSSHTASST